MTWHTTVDPKYACADCKGTGVNAEKTRAHRAANGDGYIRCWSCNGNGADPAKFFRPYDRGTRTVGEAFPGDTDAHVDARGQYVWRVHAMHQSKHYTDKPRIYDPECPGCIPPKPRPHRIAGGLSSSGEVEALLAGASVDDILEHRLEERFWDRSSPDTGLSGGQGGAAGGSPMSNAADRVSGAGNAPACPSCKDQLQLGPDGVSSCPACGFTAARAANADTQRQGGDGVAAGSKPGYLRVPGGSFDTNEAAPGIVRLKYNGNMMFEMDMHGARIEHALANSHTVMSHRLRALGYNRDRVACSLIEWLFNEAKSGDELIWNLVDGSRMIIDKTGYRRHVESYYDQ